MSWTRLSLDPSLDGQTESDVSAEGESKTCLSTGAFKDGPHPGETPRSSSDD